jgi:hypothetical protein
MDISWQEFRAQCLEASVALLWRQWCSLGVSGHADPVNPSLLLDPEALLLATTILGRSEPRLFDEMLDWLNCFGGLISLQRLKNLHHSMQLGEEQVLSAIAAWLVTQKKHPRWKTLVSFKPPPGDPAHLFLGPPFSERSAPEPCFLTYGLRRSCIHVRGHSRSPNPASASNLMLTLRALIGVSSRVEVILFLGGGTPAYATEIARATGYAPRTLQALLSEMVLSGRVLSQEPALGVGKKIQRGANRTYRMVSADWTFLTGGSALPEWTPWAAFFRFICQVLHAIPAPGEPEKHSAVISSKIRDAMRLAGPLLTPHRFFDDLAVRSEAPGEEILQKMSGAIFNLIARM